jgi:putative transcriptional regulator
MERNDWYALSDVELLREIGKRVRQSRIHLQLTQAMLAERSGLNRTTIRDLENGKSINLMSFIPLLRMLDRLEAFDILLPAFENHPVLAFKEQHRKRVRLTSK